MRMMNNATPLKNSKLSCAKCKTITFLLLMRPLYPYILHHYFLPILYAANFLVDKIKKGLRPATLPRDRPHEIDKQAHNVKLPTT